MSAEAFSTEFASHKNLEADGTPRGFSNSLEWTQNINTAGLYRNCADEFHEVLM